MEDSLYEDDNLNATELRLGLPGIDNPPPPPQPQLPAAAAAWIGGKWAFADENEPKRTTSKAQVVGWPPVRSHRRNSFQGKRSSAAAGVFVKVSMDGVPYLRKIDLKIFMGYKDLREALGEMFKSFSLSLEYGFSEMEGCKVSHDYAIAYEDKDGDWMLAGDVPWEMFTSSCRRLRIMKGSEARGLASSP